MNADEVFDMLDKAAASAFRSLADDNLHNMLEEAGVFTLGRSGFPDQSARGDYEAVMQIGTAGGVQLKLAFDIVTGPPAAEVPDADGIAALLTNAVRRLAKQARSIERRRDQLQIAVEKAFAAARAQGASMNLVSLSCKLVRVREETDVTKEIRFVIAGTMLNYANRIDVHELEVTDAEDFERYFDDEMLPEQLERSAEIRGTKPERAYG